MTFVEMETKLKPGYPGALELWESIGRDALVYSTPLLSLRRENQQETLHLAGSGTFLREGGRYFVLTAHHVWYEVLRHGAAVGVALRETHDHRHFIETENLIPHAASHTGSWTEFGPDIVLLEIPLNHVGTIKAMRGFYELAGGDQARMTEDHNETFLLLGVPKSLGTFTEQHASLELHGMWDSNVSWLSQGDWDFFDFNGRLPPGHMSNSFGGISGGGLWRVQLRPDAKEEKIVSTVALEGVAFFELGTFEGKGIIRGHGPTSISKLMDGLR